MPLRELPRTRSITPRQGRVGFGRQNLLIMFYVHPKALTPRWRTFWQIQCGEVWLADGKITHGCGGDQNEAPQRLHERRSLHQILLHPGSSTDWWRNERGSTLERDRRALDLSSNLHTLETAGCRPLRPWTFRCPLPDCKIRRVGHPDRDQPSSGTTRRRQWPSMRFRKHFGNVLSSDAKGNRPRAHRNRRSTRC